MEAIDLLSRLHGAVAACQEILRVGYGDDNPHHHCPCCRHSGGMHDDGCIVRRMRDYAKVVVARNADLEATMNKHELGATIHDSLCHCPLCVVRTEDNPPDTPCPACGKPKTDAHFYGITAGELHDQIIESLRSWSEHMRIEWGPAGNPMDTEKIRPLDQTIACVLHRTIETYRAKGCSPQEYRPPQYCEQTAYDLTKPPVPLLETKHGPQPHFDPPCPHCHGTGKLTTPTPVDYGQVAPYRGGEPPRTSFEPVVESKPIMEAHAT